MTFSTLEAFIFDKMAETKLPGLSAALMQGGQVIWSRGFGFRDVAHGLAATPHTLFNIGSVTKSVTALAVMQLAEQGKLSLDDPIAGHIPIDLKPFGQPVRIWHLLTHTSGIPALASSESVIRHLTGAGGNWLPLDSYDDVIAFMAQAEAWAVSEPGRRWFYLNEGYQLLGYLIERCAGMPYQDYVQDHILNPLGMSRSFYTRQQVEQEADVTTPYIITGEGEHKPTTYPYRALCSNGGLVSNVLDLARYVLMYLNQGQAGDGRLLSPESVKTMTTPRVETPLRDGSFGQGGYGYGLGTVPDFLGHTLIGHSGSVLVSTAYIGFIPAEQIGVVVLANGDGYPLAQVGQVALASLLGQGPETLPFVRRDQALQELEGVYQTYKGTMQVEVRRQGDFLLVRSKDKYTASTVTLVPESLEGDQRTFYTLSGGAKLAVEFSVGDGAVDLLYERYRLKKTGPLP